MRHQIGCLAAVAALVVLSACASVKPMDYAGLDAGQAMISISAGSNAFSRYTLKVRPVGPVASGLVQGEQTFVYDVDHEQPSASGTSAVPPRAQGVVRVMRLAPGSYEIYDFEAKAPSGPGERPVCYGAPSNLAIPFTIRAGQTAYLGRYQAHELRGIPVLGFEAPLLGVAFTIQNRVDSDLTQARRYALQVPESVGQSVASADRLNHPVLVGRQRDARIDPRNRIQRCVD